MNHLACRGQPIPLPRFDGLSQYDERLELLTPVGVLHTWETTPGYRPYGSWIYTGGPTKVALTRAELSDGYYDVPLEPCPRDTTVPTRKTGTPAYWCLGISENHARWLDPQKLDDVDW